MATKRENYQALAEIVAGIENEEQRTLLTEFIDKQIENLSKKTVNTKKESEYADLIDLFTDVMADKDEWTLKELQANARIKSEDLSSQKMAVILNRMIADGNATKEVKSKITYYSLCYGEQ